MILQKKKYLYFEKVLKYLVGRLFFFKLYRYTEMCLRIKTFLNFKNPFSFVLKVNLFYKTLHRVHLNHTVSLNLSLRCVYQTRWTWWNINHNLHKDSVHTLRNTAVCNKILQSYILHALFNSDILMMIYFENKWEGTLHNA